MKITTSESVAVTVDNDDDSVKVPDAFICPITMEVMEFPLMTRTGLNFDRHAILSWIGSNGSCPLTRKPMQPSDLISNRKLHHDITRWRIQNGFLDENYEREEVEDSWESSLPSKFFMIQVTEEQQQTIRKNCFNANENDSMLSLHQRATREQYTSSDPNHQTRRLELESSRRGALFRRRRTDGQRTRRSVLRKALDAAFQLVD